MRTSVLYDPKIDNHLIFNVIKEGAVGGTRTRTPLRTTDFKSGASAIPPRRLLLSVRLL